MLKYLRGGLGSPPMFVVCQSISVVVIRAVGSGGFFFLLLSLVSSSWLVLSTLEGPKHVVRKKKIKTS
jgi:hypothetical protein